MNMFLSVDWRFYRCELPLWCLKAEEETKHLSKLDHRILAVSRNLRFCVCVSVCVRIRTMRLWVHGWGVCPGSVRLEPRTVNHTGRVEEGWPGVCRYYRLSTEHWKMDAWESHNYDKFTPSILSPAPTPPAPLYVLLTHSDRHAWRSHTCPLLSQPSLCLSRRPPLFHQQYVTNVCGKLTR